MNHESLRDFALGLPHATEHLPFDEYTLVFKVHGKMLHLGEEELSRQYVQYLSQYKIVILVFNLVPYLALMIMARS